MLHKVLRLKDELGRGWPTIGKHSGKQWYTIANISLDEIVYGHLK